MSYNATLRTSIAASIKTPADPKVSGAILQQKLLSIVDGLDAGAVFLGAITPASIPSTEANCFFLATTAGTYANFIDPTGNAIVIEDGEVAFIRSTIYQGNLRWSKNSIMASGIGFGSVLHGFGFENFSTTSEYRSGDIVVYDDNLYRFNSGKTAGEWDGTKASATTFDELLAEGYMPVTATEITSKSDTHLTITNKFAAQTTGGDADLKSGPGLLLDIKGNLDEDLNPFNADSFVSTGMDLVNPLAYLTVGNKKAYYFPVVHGAWGSYGTTQENNGYIVIGGAVIEVYFKETAPTQADYGKPCGKTIYNGNNYYTPSTNGWLTILCDDNEVPACHIAWSNYNDTVGGVFGNTVKNLSTDISWIHDWGMAFLSGDGRSVYDELDIEAGKRYRRVDRATLSSLTWTKTTESGAATTYIYTAAVSGMRSNGLWECLYEEIEVSGTSLTIRSTEIATVEELATALSGYYFYYELDTVVSANATATPENTVNDFGLSYFMLNGELVSVAAYVTEGFYQSGKDQLFNAVTYQKILAEVVAASLCDLNSRLGSIEGSISEGFNYLKVTNLDVTRQLTQPE